MMNAQEKRAVKFAVYALQNTDIDLFPMVLSKLKSILNPIEVVEIDETISLGKTFMDLLYAKTGMHASAVARDIGLTRAAISLWERRGRVPSSGVNRLRNFYGDELIDSILNEINMKNK